MAVRPAATWRTALALAEVTAGGAADTPGARARARGAAASGARARRSRSRSSSRRRSRSRGRMVLVLAEAAVGRYGGHARRSRSSGRWRRGRARARGACGSHSAVELAKLAGRVAHVTCRQRTRIAEDLTVEQATTKDFIELTMEVFVATDGGGHARRTPSRLSDGDERARRTPSQLPDGGGLRRGRRRPLRWTRPADSIAAVADCLVAADLATAAGGVTINRRK